MRSAEGCRGRRPLGQGIVAQRNLEGGRGPWLWLMVFSAVGMMACLVYPVFHFLKAYNFDANAFNNAGSFFNLAYGIPVSLFGALFAVVIAVASHRLSSRQGDLDILRFVEERSSQTVQFQRQALRALGESLELGRWARFYGRDLLDMMGPGGKVPDTELNIFLAILGQLAADATETQHDATLDAYEADIARWAARWTEAASPYDPTAVDEAIQQVRETIKGAGRICQSLKSTTEDMAEAVEGLSNELPAAMFSRDQISALPSDLQPVPWLRRWLEGRLDAAQLPRSDIDWLARELRRLAGLTVARELLLAVAVLPEEADDLDIIGMILMREDFDDAGRHPVAIPGATVFFNVGAAYYLNALLLTPTKASIIQSFLAVFDDGFKERRRVALRYLNRLLPDPDAFGYGDLAQRLKIDARRLNRLIVILPARGPAEFYDPGRHPPIWRDNRPAGPFVAVRRLFNRA